MAVQYTPTPPSLVREPFHRDGWVYEKVDGWRILRFADITAAVVRLSPRSLVLDGEVAIYDQRLRSRFEWLREPDPVAVASPPLFMAFDLLYLDRRDLTARRLRDRRALLGDVVANNDLVFPVAPACARWAGGVEAGG